MISPTWWKRAFVALGMGGALSAALCEGPRAGHSAEPVVTPQEGEKFQYYGSATCKGCHNVSATNQTAFPKASGFIQLDEWKTWDSEDKHSVAYRKLDGDRGRRIASLLKLDVSKPEAGCLGCHSASVTEQKRRSPEGGEFNLNDGVSCENCHGPYSEWAARHLNASFRTLGAESWEKLGFVDLRSPDRQASKCLSCHIGDSGEGKVVTHEMYAAGHPPLPSIEVATFTNSIPRHWWLLAERKDPNLRKALGYEGGQLEQAKLAIVGAAVALKMSLKLLADEAKSAGEANAPGQDWPDYARFDCWSCHHDLKRESWRQARGYKGGPPGRVPVAEWPRAIVDLGIDHLALSDPAAQALRSDLERYEKDLHEQASIRPFGKSASIAKVAGEFAAWSDALIKKLAASKFDQASARKLLRGLVEKAATSTPDYDSARHVGWTIKLLVGELGDSPPNRPEIEAIVAKLDRGLKLELPAGRKYEIEDQIAEAFNVIGDYDPATFKAQLAELLSKLPPG